MRKLKKKIAKGMREDNGSWCALAQDMAHSMIMINRFFFGMNKAWQENKFYLQLQLGHKIVFSFGCIRN